jgi:hypothetical protein
MHLFPLAVAEHRACGSLARASLGCQSTSSRAAFRAHNCRACAVGASWVDCLGKSLNLSYFSLLTKAELTPNIDFSFVREFVDVLLHDSCGWTSGGAVCRPLRRPASRCGYALRRGTLSRGSASRCCRWSRRCGAFRRRGSSCCCGSPGGRSRRTLCRCYCWTSGCGRLLCRISSWRR